MAKYPKKLAHPLEIPNPGMGFRNLFEIQKRIQKRKGLGIGLHGKLETAVLF